MSVGGGGPALVAGTPGTGRRGMKKKSECLVSWGQTSAREAGLKKRDVKQPGRASEGGITFVKKLLLMKGKKGLQEEWAALKGRGEIYQPSNRERSLKKKKKTNHNIKNRTEREKEKKAHFPKLWCK